MTLIRAARVTEVLGSAVGGRIGCGEGSPRVWPLFRNLTTSLFGAVLLVLAAVFPASASDRWLTSYDDAMREARDLGRPVLTIFTGSDWCPHCVTLEKNVLDTDTFLAWAQDRVVLLMIDLPQQGISQEERHSRSRVCIKYGVRTFPSALLIGPDGAKITVKSGYQGQSASSWVAALENHLPPSGTVQRAEPSETAEKVHSSLDDAVATARDAKRPILIMVSRPSDSAAKTALASLIKDPEFESLARDHFVVATVPPAGAQSDAEDDADVTNLLGGVDLPPEGVELIVTDDGQTPLFSQSGSQPPHRVVSGLRRFLAARQAIRR